MQSPIRQNAHNLRPHAPWAIPTMFPRTNFRLSTVNPSRSGKTHKSRKVSYFPIPRSRVSGSEVSLTPSSSPKRHHPRTYARNLLQAPEAEAPGVRRKIQPRQETEKAGLCHMGLATELVAVYVLAASAAPSAELPTLNSFI